MPLVILAEEQSRVEPQMRGELVLHGLDFLLCLADPQEVLDDLQSLLFSIHSYYCIYDSQIYCGTAASCGCDCRERLHRCCAAAETEDLGQKWRFLA